MMVSLLLLAHKPRTHSPRWHEPERAALLSNQIIETQMLAMMMPGLSMLLDCGEESALTSTGFPIVLVRGFIVGLVEEPVAWAAGLTAAVEGRKAKAALAHIPAPRAKLPNAAPAGNGTARPWRREAPGRFEALVQMKRRHR